MTAYFITCSIIFGLLFFIWSKDRWVNALIKFMLLGMTVWSLFLWFETAGYIVKEQVSVTQSVQQKSTCDKSKSGFMGPTCE